MREKLREANRILVEHSATLLGITLLIWIPMAVVEIYLIEAAQSPLQTFVFTIASSVFSFGLWTLGLGALIQAYARFQIGDQIGVRKSLRHSTEVWHRVTWSWLVSWVFIVVGLVCFILPGIYLMVKYAFVPHLAALEEIDGSEARRRSWHLTDGRGWSLAGVYLLFFIPVWLVMYLVNMQVGGTFGGGQFVRLLVDVAGSVVMLWPFTAVFLYFWEARLTEPKVEHLPQELLQRERDIRLANGLQTGSL